MAVLLSIWLVTGSENGVEFVGFATLYKAVCEQVNFFTAVLIVITLIGNFKGTTGRQKTLLVKR